MDRTNLKQIKKKVSNAFGKKIYLLGKNKDRKYLYLEEPSWDCDWYWGFGYIETYTNNKNPSASKDIDSHQHYEGCIVGQMYKYDFVTQTMIKDKYVHHLNENSNIVESVLTDDESWKLAELMSKFNTLNDTAHLFHKGSSGVASTEINKDFEQEKLYNYFNFVLIPKIFIEIDKLLNPNPDATNLKDYSKFNLDIENFCIKQENQRLFEIKKQTKLNI